VLQDGEHEDVHSSSDGGRECQWSALQGTAKLSVLTPLD